MKLRISEIHRLALAHKVFAAGCQNADGRNVPILKTPQAKLVVARNLAALRRVLEPAETAINEERDRLATDATNLNLDQTGLNPTGARALAEFVRDINTQEQEVCIDQIPDGGIDLDALVGAEAMDALSELTPYLGQ